MGKGELMRKRYIIYNKKQVYAIYYRNIDTVFYNTDFMGETQLILLY